MLQIHNGNSLRVESIFIENTHSLALIVQRDPKDGGDVEFSVFGLPLEYVDKVIAAFGEPRRCSYVTEQTVYPREMRELQEENAKLRAEIRDLTASKLEVA